MRIGHTRLVFIYILSIHKYTLFLLSGNLDPGSTHIISLSAHNKVGFSKSARLRVSLPTESRPGDAGQSNKVLLAADNLIICIIPGSVLNLTQASSSTFLVSSTTVMLVLSLVLVTAAATDFGLYKLRGRGIMPSLILITGHIIRQIIAYKIQGLFPH